MKKFKHSFLIVLIINLLVRIPRMVTSQGLDGFIVIWEAQLILNGKYFHNGFNFLTLLGLTDYSGYPIGILLLASFFLLITGRNVMISILLYDLFFTLIFVAGVYYLSSTLELKQSAKIYFMVILTTLPNIVSFSYFTMSARFAFFAALPFIIGFLLKFNKEKKVKYFIFALILTLALNFFHRMALIVFIPVLISLAFFFIDKLTKKDILMKFHNEEIKIKIEQPSTKKEIFQAKFIVFLNYVKKRFWIFGFFGLLFLGFILFGLNFESVFYSARFNVFCYLQAICECKILYLFVQPIIDQWFHFGIPFILTVASVILMLIPKFESSLKVININQSNLKLVYLILPFIFIYNIIYSLYFLSYFVALIGAVLIQQVEKKRYRHYLWALEGILIGVFISAYHFLTETKVLPYLIIGLFITCVSIMAIVLLSIQNTRKYLSLKFGSYYNKAKLSMAFFIGLFIINSIFIVDRTAIFTSRDNAIFEHITQEEKDIAEFLLQDGFGAFDSFDNTLSVHIAALSGWYFLQDQHNIGAFLLENRTVADIDCQVANFSDWVNMHFFESDSTDGRKILYSQLFVMSCVSYRALRLMKIYNLKYFISSRHTNTSNAWQYVVQSDFIESLYSYVPIVKTTMNYYIWNTSTLYS